MTRVGHPGGKGHGADERQRLVGRETAEALVVLGGVEDPRQGFRRRGRVLAADAAPAPTTDGGHEPDRDRQPTHQNSREKATARGCPHAGGVKLLAGARHATCCPHGFSVAWRIHERRQPGGTDGGRLPPRGVHRRGWHGHGLPRGASRARPGRGQDSAASAGAGPDRGQAFPARGRVRRPRPASQHRPDLRLRRHRRVALPGPRVGAGRAAGGVHQPLGTAGSASGGDHRRAARRGAGVRAQGRDHSPGSQARQHHVRSRHPDGQAAGLRDRARRGAQPGGAAHACRVLRRNAPVCGARDTERRAGERAGGRV